MKTTKILVIALLFFALLLIPNIVNASTYGDWTYEVYSGKVILQSYNGTAANVSIPNTINGYPVTQLEGNLFQKNAKNLRTVNIPENVEELGGVVYSPFEGCNLTTVTFASNCKVKIIQGFKNMTNLTSVNIPNNVEEINVDAFAGCKSLKKITIPNSVKYIDGGAFENTGITEITIPANVEKLGGVVTSAFEGCNLRKVTFASNCKIKTIGGFENMVNLTIINIPNNVEEIEVDAFAGCKSLKTITIPNSVKYINAGAFENTGITEITIPANVEKLGGIVTSAFEGCDLHKVTFASNCKLTTIDGFKNMVNLTSINIPNNVELIDGEAFLGCKSLKSITLPSSVKKIEYSAFKDCTNLEEIVIPRSVTEIRSETNPAFKGCNKLTIYCYSTGTAIEYAKQNKIKYKRIDNIQDYTISGIEEKIYTGKPITLNISLKQRNVTLRAGTDYTVSYANNTKLGTATVTLIGKGNYSGTVKKQFSIVKQVKLGDINRDGKIDTKDARLALLAYVGKQKLTTLQIQAADVNKDKKVDTKDARQILLYYVGKIKNF